VGTVGLDVERVQAYLGGNIPRAYGEKLPFKGVKKFGMGWRIVSVLKQTNKWTYLQYCPYAILKPRHSKRHPLFDPPRKGKVLTKVWNKMAKRAV
jgi:hypothetical protein